MTITNLQRLLESMAENFATGSIISYPRENTQARKVTTYAALLHEARHNGDVLRSLNGFQAGSVVLLHLTDQLSGILWFWSVLYAGGLPAMSTPFSNNSNHRILHIEHLSKMLKHPFCITSESSLDQFSGQKFPFPLTIESLERGTIIHPAELPQRDQCLEDTALLMLTSGSTGNAKAVCLSHGQILASVAGKSLVVPLPREGSFLNWIALDHVASLIEIHIQALFLGVDQVHVEAADIIIDPIQFVRLIDEHRVSRTFAPNFFLARLRSALESLKMKPNWDLSCLRYLASGGEANASETCIAVTSLLAKYGAPETTIVPGFGMTETCAGSIFNTTFPSYEIKNDLEFASVGKCIPGIEMRITNSSSDNDCTRKVGDLEVRGHVVFKEYFNNPSATTDAFTRDGWFRTGDRAFIDSSSGNLNLVGRTKETLVVNGVKYNPREVEWAIEEAGICGVTESFTTCFSSLRSGSSTETIYVVYLPTYSAEDDTNIHVDTLKAIMRVVMIHTGARPEVLPVERAAFHKSTLGKLSRTKIKQSFEKGDYSAYEDANRNRMTRYRHRPDTHQETSPANLKEALQKVFASTLELRDSDYFDVNTPIFEMGITSIDLIRLKRNIEEHLGLSSPIPIITLMTNPTICSLAAALRTETIAEYDPVVVIQPNGTKAPLWLVHPGVGEVLVFLNLAKYLPERPVYAFRARGFNKGEPYFSDIREAATTYHESIKRRQPNGPYALAGYSYGSMLAYETAKILESNGDQVNFLGVFNLPPHIKSRMRQLSWVECILHLSYFLNLITEKHSRELATELCESPREKVLAAVLTSLDAHRLTELALTPIALVNWANLAYSLQSMAVDYEPLGSVAEMDVFYCTPLAVVAASRQQWLEEHLTKWSNFVRGHVKFHEVDGEHYTMIGKEHVFAFQKILKNALKLRGF